MLFVVNDRILKCWDCGYVGVYTEKEIIPGIGHACRKCGNDGFDEIKLMAGDIFLTNSYSIPSRMVRFLMIAPTIWQHAWRAIRGKNQPARFYHTGMIISENQMIEQQRKVRLRDNNSIFDYKDYVIYRNKNLTMEHKNILVRSALADLGKGYDWLLFAGKLFTWLTGIKLFQRWIQTKEEEICVTRLAYWYDKIGITFNLNSWHDATTSWIDWYCWHSPDWETIVLKSEYENEE